MTKKAASELRSQKRKAEQQERWLKLDHLGSRMGEFLSDSSIAFYFKNYEQERLDRMMVLSASEDEARRDLALEMGAMRQLVTFMGEVENEGIAARKALDEAKAKEK